jgi:hypothetical protein
LTDEGDRAKSDFRKADLLTFFQSKSIVLGFFFFTYNSSGTRSGALFRFVHSVYFSPFFR